MRSIATAFVLFAMSVSCKTQRCARLAVTRTAVSYAIGQNVYVPKWQVDAITFPFALPLGASM